MSLKLKTKNTVDMFTSLFTKSAFRVAKRIMKNVPLPLYNLLISVSVLKQQAIAMQLYINIMQ
jgi:hypothetical protein